MRDKLLSKWRRISFEALVQYNSAGAELLLAIPPHRTASLSAFAASCFKYSYRSA